jgi:hypothetical protein
MALAKLLIGAVTHLSRRVALVALAALSSLAARQARAATYKCELIAPSADASAWNSDHDLTVTYPLQLARNSEGKGLEAWSPAPGFACVAPEASIGPEWHATDAADACKIKGVANLVLLMERSPNGKYAFLLTLAAFNDTTARARFGCTHLSEGRIRFLPRLPPQSSWQNPIGRSEPPPGLLRAMGEEPTSTSRH